MYFRIVPGRMAIVSVAVACALALASAAAQPAPDTAAQPAPDTAAQPAPDTAAQPAPDTAATADDVLTRSEVIALAGSRSGVVLEAELRLGEARGRLADARALALDNPELEVVTGEPGDGERRTEAELTLPIGPGFKRAKRIGLARREFERDEQLARDARRLAVGAALEAWYRALHAGRRVALATERLGLAEELARTAEERFRSGGVARLDWNVAQMELSRARSELESERQEQADVRSGLEEILGLPPSSDRVLEGDLADRQLFEAAAAAAAGEPASDRPDVRAAERDVAAARAAGANASAAWLPDLAFRLNYEDQGGITEWMPGLALELPIFSRGQGERTLARARRTFSEQELQRRRFGAAREVTTARSNYAAALSALSELEQNGLPRAGEVENMAGESYRSGKIDLASMLILRRDALETRRDHADRLLEAALRGVRLMTATGGTP